MLYIPLVQLCKSGKTGTFFDSVANFVLKGNMGYEEVDQVEFKKLITHRAKCGDLLWIFDGWSELEDISLDGTETKETCQHAREILSFIDQDSFIFAKAIITGRTETVKPPRFEKHLILTGLDENQSSVLISSLMQSDKKSLKMYLSNSLDLKSKGTTNAETLTTFLKDTRILSDCIHHPLLLSLACKKAGERINAELPLESPIIMEFILNTLLEHVPPNKQEGLLNFLMQFAYTTCKSKIVVSSQENLEKFCKQIKFEDFQLFKKCGLLRKFKSAKEKVYWSLITSGIHQYLQEKFESFLKVSKTEKIEVFMFEEDVALPLIDPSHTSPIAAQIKSILSEAKRPLSTDKATTENLLNALLLFATNKQEKEDKKKLTGVETDIEYISEVLREFFGTGQESFKKDFPAVLGLTFRLNQIVGSKAKRTVCFL